jgi:hypothetical protein
MISSAIGLIVLILFPIAWMILQAYDLVRLRGARRVFAAVPFVLMVPILVMTWSAYVQQSNL